MFIDKKFDSYKYLYNDLISIINNNIELIKNFLLFGDKFINDKSHLDLALEKAVLNENIELIEYLIEINANIRGYHNECLKHASSINFNNNYNKPQILKYLLEQGEHQKDYSNEEINNTGLYIEYGERYIEGRWNDKNDLDNITNFLIYHFAPTENDHRLIWSSNNGIWKCVRCLT